MKSFGVAFATLCVLVVSLVSCGGAFSQAPRPLSTQQMVSHEGYSTVALVDTDPDNDDDLVSDTRPYCSAVWVDDTHILTAYHCVKSEHKRLQARQDQKEEARKAAQADCNPIAKMLGMCDDEEVEHKVIETKGMPMHYIVWNEVDDVSKEPTGQHLAHVVGWDESHDLALLRAAGHAIPGHEVAKLAAAVPGMGEHVHVCGHVKGLYWTFLEGSMAGYRGDFPHKVKKDEVGRSGPYMQLQVPVYYGNSGGGAFNDSGELIGIADFLMNLPAEGFFIPVDPVRAFLVDQEVLPGKVKKVEAEKKEEKPPVVSVTVVQVTPPSGPVEKADVIPAPPLPIPLPKTGGLGSVPHP